MAVHSSAVHGKRFAAFLLINSISAGDHEPVSSGQVNILVIEIEFLGRTSKSSRHTLFAESVFFSWFCLLTGLGRRILKFDKLPVYNK